MLERPPLRAALTLAEPQPHDRVLDLGTGTGALLRELARDTPHPAEVVGVDSSQLMLARARAAKLPPHFRVELGDARSLEFAADRFDLVFCAYVVNVVPAADAIAILAEAERVLAPGGRLVVVAAVAPRSLLARPYRTLWRALARTLPQYFGSFRLTDPEALFAGAGLAVHRRQFVRLGYPSLCLLHRRSGRRSPSLG
ncbi:MAG: class I SAM-dependent methyltransferase [Gaiellaceae bacterium]